MSSREPSRAGDAPAQQTQALRTAAQAVLLATSSAQVVVAWFGPNPGWLRVGRKGRPEDAQLDAALARLRAQWQEAGPGCASLEGVDGALAVPLGPAPAAQGAVVLVRPADPQSVPQALIPLAPMLGLMASCIGTGDSRADPSSVQLRLQVVLDTVKDAVVSIGTDGRIKWANRAATQIFGWEVEELVGRNISLLVPAPHAALHDGYIRDYLEGKPSAVVGGGRRVASGKRRSGEVFPVELSVSEAWDGGVRFFVGVARDVSLRQALYTEQSILASELEAVLDASAAGIVAFNARGDVRHANHACAELLGVGTDSLRAMKASDVDALLCANMDDPGSYIGLREAIEDIETLLAVHAPRKAVLRRTVRRSRSTEGEGGRVMFLRDVTREYEVDRMKTEFLSTAAHELRTPMASIHGFAELLLKREFDREIRQDMITTIHRQSSAMVELVNELLDLARIEARAGKDFRIRPCELGALLRTVCEDMRGDADARQIVLQVPETEVLAWADADKFRLALVNVISNALKYSPSDQPVEVGLAHLAESGQVLVLVADRGAGMSPDQIERIFERFYRADPSGPIPGTGLGMTLVKEILTIHEGTVHVRPRAGGGLEVTLGLRPVDADASGRLVGQ